MPQEEVTMMMSVVPGAMTGISTLMSGLVSVNNIFMDMTRQIDSSFGLIDSTIVTTGAVVAQLGFQAAQAFGEFEQGMKVVQMVSNQTASDMDFLAAANHPLIRISARAITTPHKGRYGPSDISYFSFLSMNISATG